jgi:glucosaminylphosphatidylinositol acyltransferase
MSSYKSVKEGFVSDTTGSSVLHVNLVSAVALVSQFSIAFDPQLTRLMNGHVKSSIALHSALSSRLPTNQPLHFTPEWVILTLPLLLSITYFANMPALLSVILLLPTGVLLLVPPRESGTPLPSGYTSAPHTPPPPPYASLEPELAQPSEQPSSKEKSLMITPLPALTTYRAHMILMTILCILAVDFQVFPRALAKCETWGVSLVRSASLASTIPPNLVGMIPDGLGRGIICLLARHRLCNPPPSRSIMPHGPAHSETRRRGTQIPPPPRSWTR